MKMLFLGSVIRTEDCTKFIGPSVAGNKMQVGLIKGLYNLFKDDLTVFTQVPIGAFPKENKLVMNSGKINLVDNISAYKIPFINIFIIKQLVLIINTAVMLFRWGLKHKYEEKVIITFNAFPYISIPALLVSKLLKIKTISLFADPPIEVMNRGIMGQLVKNVEDKSTVYNIKKYEGLIVLNEKSVKKYAPNKPYILVDGGFDLEDAPTNEVGGQWLTKTEDEAVIGIFSGALTEYNGIKNLIKAMEYIESNYFKLRIYGFGPLKDYVENAALLDNRIEYMGNVPNDEMMKIQQSSGILINPRIINDPVSLYTFPSKMIEYLLSGTTVATTKLNGLTEEYLENVFIFKDDSPAEIANTINFVLEQDKNDLIERAEKARRFIVRNKSWDTHCEKIIKFIDYL